jgi:hypothetical protein
MVMKILYRNRKERSLSLMRQGMRILTSLVAVRMVSWFAIDAFLRLGFGVSLLFVRIARCSMMAGFTAATNADECEHHKWSDLPQLTLHA